MRLRRTNSDDLLQLKSLWALGFGDTQEEIDAFFSLAYPDALGFCAQEDGQLLAACYAMPQRIVCADGERQAAYVYAVTTHPDFRRRGICAKLLGHAEKELRKRYFDCMLLVPADEPLRRYYEALGFHSQCGTANMTFRAPEGRGVCRESSPQAYAGMRETLLGDVPHVQYSLTELRYQQSMSGLYQLELGMRMGCASAHVEGDALLVEEILPDSTLLPALVKKLPAAVCRVRMAGGTEPFAMCKWLSDRAQPDDLYLAFDFG